MMKRWSFPIAWGILAAFLLACIFYFFVSPGSVKKPAGPPEKIIFSFAVLPETALSQIAQANGYFLQEGLEVTPHLHPFGQPGLQEVIDGRADFATVAETPFMFAVLNGERLAIIATIQSSSKNNAIIARRDRGIEVPANLRGKKIAATLGTTSHFFLNSFLVMQGLSLKEVTIVNLKPGDLQSALVGGRVDAVSAFHPFLHQIEKKLGARGISFFDENIYTETFHIVVRQDFIDQKPETLRKVLRALIRAEEFLAGHPTEARRIVSEFSRVDPATLEAVWNGNSFSISLNQLLLLTLEDESRWAIRNGLTPATKVPNYLSYIHLDGLKSVKPDAVNILR